MGVLEGVGVVEAMAEMWCLSRCQVHGSAQLHGCHKHLTPAPNDACWFFLQQVGEWVQEK